MKFTGERMMLEINNSGMYAEHMARYKFAAQFVKDKLILDLACGSGYGSSFLKDMGAKEVTGIDISAESIDYCKKLYKNSDINFIVGNVDNIPFGDNSIDVMVSLETLEHVDGKTQKEFLIEVKRVLKEDGIFIVSTPNISVTPGNNPFHLKELTYGEFSRLLKNYFSYVDICFQDNIEASFVTSDDFLNSGINNSSREFNVVNAGKIAPENCLYFVAVCGKEAQRFQKQFIVISDIKPWKRAINHEMNTEMERIKQQLICCENEMNLLRLSKFWKLRNRYNKIKSFFHGGK